MGEIKPQNNEIIIEPQIKEWFDNKKTLTERKQLFANFMDTKMNPISTDEFNPDTWDPTSEFPESELVNRERKVPPKQLPTLNIKPKEIREGQMIGMYESKQDIYLILAYRCNEMQTEIDNLKTTIIDLQNQIELIK